MNENTTEQQKPQLPTQISDAYLADFAKARGGKEERGLRVLLMSKISTTATNQPEHTKGSLLDTQRERKREPDREAL